MNNKKTNIVITGYPYAYPYYFKVFEYAENKVDLVFILPKRWEAKKGKVKIDLKDKTGFKIYGLPAWSFGGKSLFGGLFKGWMPAMCLILPYIRLKYSPGVIYSCSEPNLLTTLFNGFWAKILGFKHVLFTWQNVPPKARMSGLKLKLSNFLVKINLAFSDGVICGNKKAQNIIVQVFKFPISKTIVCPLSGVDVVKFKPGIVSDCKEKLGIGDEKVILFYGALEKRKGIDVLLDAFVEICNLKIENCKLILVGTGPEGENLKLKVQSLKLKDKVVFLDWVDNSKLPDYLDASDVFVYPSVPFGGWEEQFGYAMAEASACCIPVVATKTGSINEVVLNGESGILVEPNNPSQLAEAINKIISNPELAKKMGKFGREYVVGNFSQPVIANKILSFLKRF